MITQITVEGFKLLRTTPVPLSRVTTIVGPNNGGKTSLLQSLMAWQLALHTWVKRRKYDPSAPEKLTAKKRPGVRLNLEELTFVEVGTSYELWPDLLVFEGPNKPALIKILVEGVANSIVWKCGMEFQFSDEKSVNVRPSATVERGEFLIPQGALDEVVVLNGQLGVVWVILGLFWAPSRTKTSKEASFEPLLAPPCGRRFVAHPLCSRLVHPFRFPAACRLGF